MTEKDERAAVRKFYSYQHPQLPFVLWIAIGYGLITAALLAAGISGGWLLLFGAAVAYIVNHLVTERSRRKFGELAVKTREIQARDALDAFLRVFKRTQLKLEDLHTLDEAYQFEKERDLFREVRLEERMGEIYNKSIRMWSRSARSQLQWRRVNWDDGRTEVFYNPVRVVALFLSTDAVVICDSEVDSSHFSLKESISRVMVSDIVTIRFHSTDEKFNMSDAQIMSMAAQYKYSANELKELSDDLEHRATRDPRYLQEEVGASLAITQKDGSALEFPIFSRVGLRRPSEAHQRANIADLTEDELTVDRMMNELNRIVASAKQRRMA